MRIDPSQHFLGLRLNMYIATALTLAGMIWFVFSQRAGRDGSHSVAHAVATEPSEPGVAGRRWTYTGHGLARFRCVIYGLDSISRASVTSGRCC